VERLAMHGLSAPGIVASAGELRATAPDMAGRGRFQSIASLDEQPNRPIFKADTLSMRAAHAAANST
jgi:hypothetical protein